MEKMRLTRAALGYPVWTVAQVGDTLLVVIDNDCPESEETIRAYLTSMQPNAMNIIEATMPDKERSPHKEGGPAAGN